MKKHLIAVAALISLGGCASNMDAYRGMQPELRYEKFFEGRVDGKGIVQDRSGKVIKRFDVTLNGAMRGDEFVQTEHYDYYDDRKTQDRVNHIRVIDDTHYTGNASDYIGTGTGERQGFAIDWKYTMQVPTEDGKIYDMDFDDRMYLLRGDTIIDRNAMSKYGVHIADITIVMTKQTGK